MNKYGKISECEIASKREGYGCDKRLKLMEDDASIGKSPPDINGGWHLPNCNRRGLPSCPWVEGFWL